MISTILPTDVVAVEQVGKPCGTLMEDESDALGHAIQKRIEEFAAGRTCARLALNALGVPAQPILRGSSREPLWPLGIVNESPDVRRQLFIPAGNFNCR